MNNTLINLTIPTQTRPPVEYVNVTTHAINPYEIILILGMFATLSYLYVMVRKDKEKYSAWKNPNGRTINLYKQVKIFFWLYVAIVIILGAVQAFFLRG